MSLYTRTKNDEGKWRYNAIPEGRGKKTSRIEPPFYARPRYQGRQMWMRLGATTLGEAHTEADKIGAGFVAKSQGLSVAELDHVQDANRLTIQRAVDNFISETAKTKKKKTVLCYQLHLKQFVESTMLRYMDQITKTTICDFRDYLAGLDYEARTQHNRVLTVLSLLKKHKIETGFSLKKDLPTFEEEAAVPFSDDELRKLFAAMDEDERVRYKFYLGTAAREQEVSYATWADVDLSKKVFHVRKKEGFSPKNHESRSIPLADDLVEMLRAHRKKYPNQRWLFANEDGNVDGHHLRKLKRIALRAGINCGMCETDVTKGRYTKYKAAVTCKTDPVCKHVFLHRLRKTCATRWHDRGIPIRTLQNWLAHKSLETTQLYLGTANSAALRGQINSAFGGD